MTSTDKHKVSIDTRNLSHPAPLDIASQSMQELDEESYLYMLHTKNPIPLLDLAKEKGYRVLSQETPEEEWEIIITKNTNLVIKELLSTYS